MSYLERAPIVVPDKSLLDIEPQVRAGTVVHVPNADTLQIGHELILTAGRRELLIMETVDVVVGNEAKVAGAVKPLVEALGETTLETAIDETDEIVGELRLFLRRGELGGDEILSGVLLGCSLGSHDVVALRCVVTISLPPEPFNVN